MPALAAVPVACRVKRFTERALPPRAAFDADDRALLNRAADNYHERLLAAPEAQVYLLARGLNHPETVYIPFVRIAPSCRPPPPFPAPHPQAAFLLPPIVSVKFGSTRVDSSSRWRIICRCGMRPLYVNSQKYSAGSSRNSFSSLRLTVSGLP